MRLLSVLAFMVLTIGMSAQADTLLIPQMVVNRLDSVAVQLNELSPQLEEYNKLVPYAQRAIELEGRKREIVEVMLETLGFEIVEGKLMKDNREYTISGSKIYRIKQDE